MQHNVGLKIVKLVAKCNSTGKKKLICSYKKKFDINFAMTDVVNKDSSCIINDKWRHVYSLHLQSLQKLKGLLECFVQWKKLDMFRFDENWDRICCVLTWYSILDCLHTMLEWICYMNLFCFDENWVGLLKKSIKIDIYR